MKRTLSILSITTTLFISSLSYTFSQVVTNGSFTNATGNSFTPAGWANTPGNVPGPAVDPFPSVDVLGVGFTSYTGASVVAATPSPDGGTWVGLSSIWNMENEAIQQVVTGLVIGQTYQASLWVANFGGPGFQDAGTITIYANNVGVVTSPVLNLVANVWTQITGTFVATATNMTIQIDAYHSTDPATGSGYYSVDGLVIIPLCNAGGTPILSQTNICTSQSTFDLSTITASNTPVGGILTWHSGIPVSAATQLASITNVPLGNYYAAFYNAAGNCYSPPQLVQLNANPVASFTAANTCAGTNVTFVNTSTVPAPNAITGWSWLFGDNATSAIQNPTHLFAAENNYSNQLTVTANNGCTSIVTVPVSVYPLPAVSFNVANVCQENTSTFNNTTTISSANTPNTISNWLWTFGDGSNLTTQNATHTYVNSGTYNVTLQATSAFGCVNSLTQPTIIHPKPIASFTAVNSCVGLNTNFANTSTTAVPDAITTWAWTFGDNTTSAIQNPSHLFATENIYSNQLIVTTNNGCEDTTVASVSIWPLPVINFTANNACLEMSTTLVNNSTISNTNTVNNITAWSWDLGDGNTLNTFDGSYNYTNPGNYNISLQGTSNNGCVNSLTLPVVINPKPNALFTSPNVCNGLNSSFTDASTVLAPSTIITWAWEFGDGATSTTQNPTHLYALPGDYNVQQIVTTNSGCKDTISVQTTVYPLPVASFTSPNNCEGVNSVFTNTSTVQAPDVITNWDWTFGDLATSALENPTHLFATENVYANQLTVTTGNGCQNSVTNNLTIWPLPAINFTFNNACLESTTTFNNTTTISNINSTNSVNTWLWNFDDGNTSTSQNGNNTYLAAGNYNVTLEGTSNNGCVSNLQQPITVYPKPVANYSVDDVCVNLATTFTDLSTINGGGIISNWDWTFGDLATSTVQNPTHIYGAENIYNTRLIVTTTDGCKDTLSAQATVYPRPIVDFTATNVCQEFSNQFTANTTISNLYTTNTIATWNYIFNDGSNSNLQNVSHLYLNDGVYNVYLVATSNHGCADSIQKLVTVYPKPNAVISGINLSGCSPICPSLTSVSTVNAPSTIAQMNWEYSDGALANGTNSIRCLDNNSGQTEFYGVTLFVETNNGCKDTAINLNYIQVYHNPIADFSFSPTTPDIQNNIIEFTNTSLNASTYQWNISNGQFSTLTNPKVELSDGPGYYLAQLTAFTPQGCFDTISERIFIKDVVTYWIPNTFTPDGNEYNNTWKPIIYSGIDESSIHFMVFNRWGEMIWESFDQNQGWDGSYAGNLAQNGTYSWVFEYKIKGVDERKKDVGHLNIIR